MTDSPPSSQDSVDTIRNSVLQAGCLLCGGELLGRKDRYFVCTSCNHLFSEERLISAAKPLPEPAREEVRDVGVEREEELSEEGVEEAGEQREDTYYESAFSRDR